MSKRGINVVIIVFGIIALLMIIASKYLHIKDLNILALIIFLIVSIGLNIIKFIKFD
ncbi:hypothetical protein KTT_20100 [Tengunoibacter tsumagoiensis]|uniref:Uncharacterized protein n=1 Tax=Tengunoibacter tsumagoiensis TaxID=2014871 RepID=A0A401ZZ93_9CHLR|nr:hypothetical protein KTT_20100 [Tengunoibacter tsumagoiensis]